MSETFRWGLVFISLYCLVFCEGFMYILVKLVSIMLNVLFLFLLSSNTDCPLFSTWDEGTVCSGSLKICDSFSIYAFNYFLVGI